MRWQVKLFKEWNGRMKQMISLTAINQSSALVPLFIFLILLTGSTRIVAQVLDRYAMTQAYAHSSLGEWTLGDVIIGDISKDGQQLHQGFLAKVFPTVTAVVAKYNDQDIMVFPNPCTDQFQVLDHKLRDLNIKLFDLDGRLVLQKSAPVTNSLINISDLINSAYLLWVEAENQLVKTEILIKSQ